MYDFSPEQETDLALRQGDIVTNLNTETGQDGWWYGTIGTKSGFFPRDYVMK